MTDDSENALRAALAAGRTDAFGEFYDRHAAALFAVAKALSGSTNDAEDAVQQTFVDLFRARTALAVAANPRGYALRALRHNVARMGARQALHAGLDEMPEPAIEDAPTPEPDQHLERALAALPKEQREVLTLKLDGELTFEELATVLDIPADTAASRYRRALEKLRERLGGAR